MSKQRIYTISELRRTVNESVNVIQNASGKNVLREKLEDTKQEFEPVYGKDVPKDNKKINTDAYKSIDKEIKNYDGGVKNPKKNIDYSNAGGDNRGMEDVLYTNLTDENGKLTDGGKAFTDKVKSQTETYVSSLDKELHGNEALGNAERGIPVNLDKKVNKIVKGREMAKTDGLTSNKEKEELKKSMPKSAIGEGKLMKLKFKNTVFMTENHMLSRVPDAYKIEGKKFIMEDKVENRYIIEWHTENEPKVLNESRANEQQNRIKQLFNYKSNDSKTSNSSRLTENAKVNDMLNKARKLMY